MMLQIGWQLDYCCSCETSSFWMKEDFLVLLFSFFSPPTCTPTTSTLFTLPVLLTVQFIHILFEECCEKTFLFLFLFPDLSSLSFYCETNDDLLEIIIILLLFYFTCFTSVMEKEEARVFTSSILLFCCRQ